MKYLTALLFILQVGAIEYTESQAKDFIQTYCISCHGQEKQKGSIDFRDLISKPELWLQAADQIHLGEMPPEEEKQPNLLEKRSFLKWVENSQVKDEINKRQSIGRSSLRRLNNYELFNTYFDLFAYKPDLSEVAEEKKINGYNKNPSGLNNEQLNLYSSFAHELMSKWLFIPQHKFKAQYLPKTRVMWCCCQKLYFDITIGIRNNFTTLPMR